MSKFEEFERLMMVQRECIERIGKVTREVEKANLLMAEEFRAVYEGRVGEIRDLDARKMDE